MAIIANHVNGQDLREQNITSDNVTVKLPSLTVVGFSRAGVTTFNGIPYAIPPIGSNRLRPPESLQTHLGPIDGTRVPMACPQLTSSASASNSSGIAASLNTTNPALSGITKMGEDCLTLNIQRPSFLPSQYKLPVVVWLYGGGFEAGSTQNYHADVLIRRSVELSKPLIFVAANYRVGGWGFMGGREIKQDGSSNLGLLDQRLALQWVSDHIAPFGGDPEAVTLWGQSAGAVSVFDQMLLYGGNNTYKGKSLFRGAIMNSGSMAPTEPVDGLKAQHVYNQVVKRAGCVGPDSLDCLRKLPYEKFFEAATSAPNVRDQSSIALSYLPRPDGVTLRESPHLFAAHGQFVKIPIIIGDQEDEGTVFSLVQRNLTTDADLRRYLKSTFFTLNDPSLVDQLVDLYPDDGSAGSPYGTSSLNTIYPQYKRLAAILGDITFSAVLLTNRIQHTDCVALVRRVMLGLMTTAAPEIPIWSYLATYGHDTPIVGTAHASDLLHSFGVLQDDTTRSMQNYYINFITTLDPNEASSSLQAWPKWQAGRQLLKFESAGRTIMPDDFRSAASDFLTTNNGNLTI